MQRLQKLRGFEVRVRSAMRYISMFSGIEAASVALEPLGCEPVCFSELPGFASEVLARRFPRVPNVGDMTAVDWRQYRRLADIVVGGPPCQAFSIAGMRGGLSDDRGNLSLQFVKAVHAIRPDYRKRPWLAQYAGQCVRLFLGWACRRRRSPPSVRHAERPKRKRLLAMG